MSMIIAVILTNSTLKARTRQVKWRGPHSKSIHRLQTFMLGLASSYRVNSVSIVATSTKEALILAAEDHVERKEVNKGLTTSHSKL